MGAPTWRACGCQTLGRVINLITELWEGHTQTRHGGSGLRMRKCKMDARGLYCLFCVFDPACEFACVICIWIASLRVSIRVLQVLYACVLENVLRYHSCFLCVARVYEYLEWGECHCMFACARASVRGICVQFLSSVYPCMRGALMCALFCLWYA